MSKQKKKRNKQYKGAGAKQTSPQVIRVAAVKRSKPGQWWHEKKRLVIRSVITAGAVVIVALLILELIRLITM